MFKPLPLLFLVALALTGCDSVRGEMRDISNLINPQANLAEINYGAADMLVGQVRETLSLSTPMAIGVLHPANLPVGEAVPPFGKVAADQIGSRLVQLGYSIQPLDIPYQQASNGSDRAWIERAKTEGADRLITGSYIISTDDVMMSLRLLNLENGRILASSDYRIPLTSEVEKLLGRKGWWTDTMNNIQHKLVNNPEQAPRPAPARVTAHQTMSEHQTVSEPQPVQATVLPPAANSAERRQSRRLVR